MWEHGTQEDKWILEMWGGYGETWDVGGYGTGAQRDIGNMGKHGTWGDVGQEHKGILETWGNMRAGGMWGRSTRGHWGHGGTRRTWGSARCDPCSCHQGVSLSLRPGELVAVLAPPGGGKSSLVAAALGLRPLAGGAVLLDGIPLTPRSDPALRQQVIQTGHPQVTTATPRAHSIPCCCLPVTKSLQCVSMATPGSAPGPQ